MTIQVITAPAYYPITLAEARAWARIDADDTENNSVLTRLIRAMTGYAENLTGRSFVQRTLRLTLGGWPECFEIELPNPPLIGVDSIKYLDTDNTELTLAADQYEVHADREPALVLPSYEADPWPVTRGVRNAVRVEYRAGYAPVGSPSDEAAHQAGQPDALKLWMQARIATLYENREQIVVGNLVTPLPHAFADGLLDELVIGSRLTG